jgi:predicted metal-dependent hydrolase
MTELVVRRLLIDLQSPFARNWCGGDAFSSAFFNALSMSFPFGEQFFIDAVRDAVATLPTEVQEKYRADVRGFIGQEATHRRIHSLFNNHLEEQGLVDGWTARANKRMALMEEADPRHALAVTAATEHFTAMFAEWLLARPEILDGAEPRLRTMWLWHSAEELEHKSVAFDIYKATGGSDEWRRRWFRRVTVMFLGDLMHQTIDNLRHENSCGSGRPGRARRASCWARTACCAATCAAGASYLRADFHPAQQDSSLSTRWLADNRAQYTPVGAAPEAAAAS